MALMSPEHEEVLDAAIIQIHDSEKWFSSKKGMFVDAPDYVKLGKKFMAQTMVSLEMAGQS